MDEPDVPSEAVSGPDEALARLRARVEVPAAAAAPWATSARARLGDLARWRAHPGARLVVAGVAGLVLGAGVVAVVALRPGPGGPAPALPLVATTLPFAPGAGPAATAPVDEVVVHVAGAVARPGLLRLPAGSRAGDAVAAAGGLAPDADGDAVNLAQPLADGSRLHVPRRGEVPPVEAPVPGTGAAGGTGGAGGPAAPIDVNAATEAQLDELPGIGPATARAIVEHRQRHGRFGAVEDLLDVPGIGPAKLDELRSRVRV